MGERGKGEREGRVRRNRWGEREWRVRREKGKKGERGRRRGDPFEVSGNLYHSLHII